MYFAYRENYTLKLPTPIKFLPFAIGFGAQLGQVVLIRELFVVFSGNEFSFGIAFAAWLLACGLGAGVASLLLRFVGRLRLLWIITTFFTLLTLGISIWAIRLSRNFFEVTRGQPLNIRELGITAIFALGGSAFFFGIQYVISIHFLAEKEEAGASAAYLYEAWGALIGGVLFTFVLVYLPSYQLLGLIGMVFLLAGVVSFRKKEKPLSVRGGILLLFTLVLLAIPIFIGGGKLDQTLEKKRWRADLGEEYQLKDSISSPFGHISHLSRKKQHYIYYNGFPYLSFPNPQAGASRAHLLFNQHPSPRNVLLIGGGPQGFSEMALYPFQKLDYLELDPYLLDLTESLASGADRKALRDSRISVYHQDGRAFIRSAPAGQYDIIALFVPSPSTASLNRYYTTEFFSEVKRALRRGGVLALTLESAYSLDERSKKAKQNRLIYHTLCKYFKNIKIRPGDINLLLCTDEGKNTSLSPEELAKRFLSKKIRSPFYSSYTYSKETLSRSEVFFQAIFETVIAPRHIVETMRAYRGEKTKQTNTPPVLPWLKKSQEKKELQNLYKTPSIPPKTAINTDEKPLAPLYYLRAWNREVGEKDGNLLSFFLKIPSGKIIFFPLGLAGFFLFLLFFFALIGRKTGGKTALVFFGMFAMGFFAMAVEMVLLVSFQCQQGYIYSALGLLIGLFMMGVGMGTALSRTLPFAPHRLFKLILLAGFLLGISLPLLIQQRGGMIFYSGLNFAGGFLIGAIYPVGISLLREWNWKEERAGSWLYSVDVWGATLASFFTTTILLTQLGISKTCFLMALFPALALVLYLVEEQVLSRIWPD